MRTNRPGKDDAKLEYSQSDQLSCTSIILVDVWAECRTISPAYFGVATYVYHRWRPLSNTLTFRVGVIEYGRNPIWVNTEPHAPSCVHFDLMLHNPLHCRLSIQH